MAMATAEIHLRERSLERWFGPFGLWFVSVTPPVKTLPSCWTVAIAVRNVAVLMLVRESNKLELRLVWP